MSKKVLKRVLIVDDDPDILELLAYNLGKEGIEVCTIENSAQVIEMALKFHPQLFILDLMMPAPDGLELCKRIRQIPEFYSSYIFFLTAKNGNEVKNNALDSGGDEFIEKVTGLRALTYKVRHLLEGRFVIRKSLESVSHGLLSLSRKSNTASFGKSNIPLSTSEFDLLFFLMQNPSKSYRLSELTRIIWGSETFVPETTIESYIESLNRKLGAEWLFLDRYRSAVGLK